MTNFYKKLALIISNLNLVGTTLKWELILYKMFLKEFSKFVLV